MDIWFAVFVRPVAVEVDFIDELDDASFIELRDCIDVICEVLAHGSDSAFAFGHGDSHDGMVASIDEVICAFYAVSPACFACMPVE